MLKNLINERKIEIEDRIEEMLEDFWHDAELCIFRVKVFWRENESGRPYPDVEVVASSEIHITPKP